MTPFDSLLADYARCPGLLSAAKANSRPSALDRAGPGGWSIRDVLVHVSDAEVVRATRFRLIRAEYEPIIFDFDEDRWQRALAYRSRDPEVALTAYSAMVEGSVEILRGRGEAVLDRAGLHPVDGRVTVRALIERGVAHAREHAAQVASLSG